MHSMIALLWLVFPHFAPPTPPTAPLVEATTPVSSQEADRPTIVRAQARVKKREEAEEPKKSAFLDVFWNIFPPPGAYKYELGVSGAASFLETAYGGINPNVLYRVHFGVRPRPRRVPIFGYGVFDYTSYGQEAGDLFYTSRYATLGVGGGLLKYIGPVRLDLAVEPGLLIRVASQGSDDFDTVTRANVQPAATAIGGIGLAVAGHVSLSMRAAARFYGLPVRRDLMILYGIEWLIGARPVDIY